MSEYRGYKKMLSKKNSLFTEFQELINIETFYLFDKTEISKYNVDIAIHFYLKLISPKATVYKNQLFHFSIEIELTYNSNCISSNYESRKIVDHIEYVDIEIDNQFNYFNGDIKLNKIEIAKINDLMIFLCQLNEKNSTIPNNIISKIKNISLVT